MCRWRIRSSSRRDLLDGVEAAFRPQRDVDERDEGGDFDERADGAGEGLAGGDAEHGDRHGDGELEVVARRGEGDRGVAVVGEAQAVAERRTSRST